MSNIVSLRVIATLLLFSIVGTALQLSLPIYSMQVFSRVIPTGHYATLIALFTLLILTNICAMLIDAARSTIISRLALKLYNLLYLDTARLTLESSLPGKQPLADLNTVRSFVSGPLAVALLDAPWSLVFIGAMFALHKILGVITVGIFGVVVGWSCLGYYLTRVPKRLAMEHKVREQNIVSTTHIDRQVVQAMGLRTAYLRDMQNLHLSEMLYIKQLETRTAWLDAGTKFLRNVFQIVILTTAAVLTLTRDVEVGAIIASTMLFSRALAPVERISCGFSQIIDARSAWSRFLQGAEKLPDKDALVILPPLVGRIALSNVTVKVATKSEPVLKNVTLQIDPGSVVIVVGMEGAGKSTLAKVICGAIAPDSGEVRLDGFNISHCNSEQLGSQVGYLPDAVRLESGSVASIIARGAPVDMDAVIDASTSVGAHEMIQRLSAGYDTVMHFGDPSISAGQLQRIAIARAIYRRPKLIVLDEPTAHLDDAGEAIVFDSLQNLKKHGSTMLIVSRLPAFHRLADRLVFVSEGILRFDVTGEALRDHVKLRLATDRSGS